MHFSAGRTNPIHVSLAAWDISTPSIDEKEEILQNLSRVSATLSNYAAPFLQTNSPPFKVFLQNLTNENQPHLIYLP
jgi:hypothetical protein